MLLTKQAEMYTNWNTWTLLLKGIISAKLCLISPSQLCLAQDFHPGSPFFSGKPLFRSGRPWGVCPSTGCAPSYRSLQLFAFILVIVIRYIWIVDAIKIFLDRGHNHETSISMNFVSFFLSGRAWFSSPKQGLSPWRLLFTFLSSVPQLLLL